MKVLVFSENETFIQEVDQSIKQYPGLELLTATDLKSALIDFLHFGTNDLLIFDYSGQDQYSLKTLHRFIAVGEEASVLTVFSHPDPEQTKYLLANGVLGGIPRQNMSKYLNDAIRVVSEKGIFFVGNDTINAEKLAEEVAKLTDVNEALKVLSKKQREVVSVLVQGCSNKQIAKDLNIELSTVKTHLTVIYKTLGITGRNQIFNRLGTENKVSQLIG